MWNEIKKIEECEVDVEIVQGILELVELTGEEYEDLERRFNVLPDCYESTPAHKNHQRMALYFIRYEINRLTGNVKKKKSLNK